MKRIKKERIKEKPKKLAENEQNVSKKKNYKYRKNKK